ncbi:hypothetical protein H6P81_015640 [Aristolochia fimbriata]|uniref:Uncharacterized protein n=1 Tax=Aristolochia fimbriata TaxID=158543 RepID=A0AAV7E632_ARIFI|nr:hypothetical protein H6P81_015640 [Aristolochia fimbriata]
MKNSTVAFALILLFLLSAHQEGVEAQIDCYDSCNTGCVNPDVRLYLRCDGKCKIRCSPDLAAAAAAAGGNRG